MRWLLRLLLYWAVTLPLFYFVALPPLMTMLDKKARAQNYEHCLQQLAAIPITQPAAGKYCHCVMDGLTFTYKDLIDMLGGREPAQLTAQVDTAAKKCNVLLQGAS